MPPGWLCTYILSNPSFDHALEGCTDLPAGIALLSVVHYSHPQSIVSRSVLFADGHGLVEALADHERRLQRVRFSGPRVYNSNDRVKGTT